MNSSSVSNVPETGEKTLAADSPEERLKQLEAMAAASATQYSPELFSMLQRERLTRSIQLSNTLLQHMMMMQPPSAIISPATSTDTVFGHHQETIPLSLVPAFVAAPPVWLSVVPFPIQPTVAHFAHQQCIPAPYHAPQQLPLQMGLGGWMPGQDCSLHSQHSRVERFKGLEPNTNAAVAIQEAGSADDVVEGASYLQGMQQNWSAAEPRSKGRTCAEDSQTISSSPLARTKKREGVSKDSPGTETAETSLMLSASVRCVKRRRYRAETFPSRLLRMMESAKKRGQQHIISFTNDGTAIRVSNPKELTEILIPKYFRHKSLASFQRQLSMYGFVRIVRGENKGAYAHPLFLEGRPDLIPHIKRTSELEWVADDDNPASASVPNHQPTPVEPTAEDPV